MPVTIPDEVLAAAHISESQLKRELALTLFQQERLTLAQASRLAEMNQLNFQALLAERLPLLYARVLIPSAVYSELTAFEHGLPAAIDLASTPWLIVASAQDRNRVEELRKNLDAGF